MGVYYGSIFFWSCICLHCSGLQRMEDHFFIYSILRVQRGKPANDWGALGKLQLLPGPGSPSESGNVQGEYQPGVRRRVWRGASKQGSAEKTGLEVEPVLWISLTVSTRAWRTGKGWSPSQRRWALLLKDSQAWWGVPQKACTFCSPLELISVQKWGTQKWSPRL